MRRKKIHITSRPDGWAVTVSGNSRASAIYGSKKKAKKKGRKKAKKLSKKKGKAELVIHKNNGVIQRKHSYGKDPGSIKG